MFELKGKVALVTGAATGIGLAYVKELLQNQLKGIALVDINDDSGQDALAEVEKNYGKGRAIFIKADVGDRNQLEGAFEATVKAFSQLDIVINNAGIIQEVQWEKCITVNLTAAVTGTMLATDHYFPKYKSGPETVVLNMASIAAFEPYEPSPAYVATKAGLVGFTRAMGGDLHFKTTNTRVIAVCPGLTATTMSRITEEQVREPYLSLHSTILNHIKAQTPEELTGHAMGLIRNAPTGSVWMLADGKCVEAKFPKLYNF